MLLLPSLVSSDTFLLQTRQKPTFLVPSFTRQFPASRNRLVIPVKVLNSALLELY